MKYIGLITISLLLFTACKEEKPLTAEAVVENAIEQAGGNNFESARISFKFRDKVYRSTRECARFMLERTVEDSLGNVTHDMVDNKGLVRLKNGKPEQVADSLVTKISDGVNSVHYFANLPYSLDGPAVNKELVGEAMINDQAYYEVKVWFNEVGGGTDFQDIFMYWINQETFTVDYLAYVYEVNGGGIRFREAYNPRMVNGIRFVDYNNYKPEDKTTRIETLDELFEKGELKLLSKIETENVNVEILESQC